MTIDIRKIKPADNAPMAAIIRQVLTEFGANRPGFAWADPELGALSEAYRAERAVYYVVTDENVVIGGGGIAPFPCMYEDVCELQKMYLLPAYRGRGLGKTLMAILLRDADAMRYRGCYLETFSAMQKAIKLYTRCGFQKLDTPLGNSGHTACNQFYLQWLHPPATPTAIALPHEELPS